MRFSDGHLPIVGTVALLSIVISSGNANAAPAETKSPPPAVKSTAPVVRNVKYNLIDLGPMVPGDDDSLPRLNKGGAVAYWQFFGGKIIAALWRDGKTVPLDTLEDFPKSYATGINDKGDIVGVGGDISMPGRSGATFWSGKTLAVSRLIPAPDLVKDPNAHDGKNSHALAINNDGVVVGSKELASGDIHAFTLSHGVFKDLGTIANGNYSFARAINKSGLIAGVANVTVNGSNHAAIWRNGVGQDLGILYRGTYSQATAVNDHGVVAGWANNGEAEVVSVIWKDGKTIDLGDLGGNPSAAWSINNHNEVVGHSFVPGKPYGPAHAYIWKDGKITDLNTMIPADTGWLLQHAYDINDKGDIVGVGSIHGAKHFFVLHRIKGK